MPKVLLGVRTMKYDVSNASDHGSVEYLFDNMSPFHQFNIQELYDAIVKRLIALDYSPGDFLCMTGPISLVAMMFTAASTFYPTVHVLLFDARDNKYYPAVLELEDG